MNKILKTMGVICLLFLVLGCVASDDTADTADTNGEVTESSSVTDEQATVVSEPQEDVVNTQSEPQEEVATAQSEYQDDEWIDSAYVYTSAVANACGDLSDAAMAGDYYTLGTQASSLYDLSQMAIDESDKYTVSPELEDAQTEYRIAMVNFNWAGLFAYTGSEDAINGNYDESTANILQATDNIKTANEHLQTATTELNTYLNQ
jgi:hypothetical protein